MTGPPLHQQQARAFAIELDRSQTNGEYFAASLSSEVPLERAWGIEILSHDPSAVDLSRAVGRVLPLLLNHDPASQIGVAENVQVKDGRLRALLRFSKSALGREVLADVLDGIRTTVSIGYQILEAVQDGQNPDGVPIYRVSKWRIYETSIAAIAADVSVGIGRSVSKGPLSMKSNNQPGASAGNGASLDDATRMRMIVDAGEQYQHHGGREIAARVVRAGGSLEDFNAAMLERMSTHPSRPGTDLGMSGRDLERYSLTRAVRALVNGDWRDAGLELEASEAVARRVGREERSQRSFFVPYDVQEMQRRDLTAATDSAGGYLVAVEQKADAFIDALRAQTVGLQLGITMLPGLIGDVSIPKMSGGSTPYWLANEATQITESNPTFGQVQLTPKNVGAYVELSRQLIMQSTPAADFIIMRELAAQLGVAVDTALYAGTGASGQPTGVLNAAGIGSVTGTSLDWADLLEFESDVAGSHALLDPAKFAYVTTPAVRGLLKGREKAASTAQFCWENGPAPGEGRVNGYRAFATGTMPSATMIAGDWSSVVMGEWGILELAVNPYADFKAAISGIRAIWSVDIGLRHALAFSAATSIT